MIPALTVDCVIFRAKLTERGCQLNQQIARRTAFRLRRYTREKLRALTQGGLSGISLAPSPDLEKLAGCCHCPRMIGRTEIYTIYVRVLREAPEVFAEYILEENNYSHDPDVQHEKALIRFQKSNQKRRERLKADQIIAAILSEA